MNLDELPDLSEGRAGELIALDDALNALVEIDPRKERVVELRFFGGLSVEETAAVLGISSETVMRDRKFARAWLGGTQPGLTQSLEKSSADASFSPGLAPRGVKAVGKQSGTRPARCPPPQFTPKRR